MSLSNDEPPQLSPENQFLECHQLLTSMMEDSSGSPGSTVTANGHRIGAEPDELCRSSDVDAEGSKLQKQIRDCPPDIKCEKNNEPNGSISENSSGNEPHTLEPSRLKEDFDDFVANGDMSTDSPHRDGTVSETPDKPSNGGKSVKHCDDGKSDNSDSVEKDSDILENSVEKGSLKNMDSEIPSAQTNGDKGEVEKMEIGALDNKNETANSKNLLDSVKQEEQSKHSDSDKADDSVVILEDESNETVETPSQDASENEKSADSLDVEKPNNDIQPSREAVGEEESSSATTTTEDNNKSGGAETGPSEKLEKSVEKSAEDNKPLEESTEVVNIGETITNTDLKARLSAPSSSPAGPLQKNAIGTPSPDIEANKRLAASQKAAQICRMAAAMPGPVLTKGKKGKDNAKKVIPKDLGPTASFLCDLGMDLVKESVYKDLISIQSRKKKSGKLAEPEEKQLVKLMENYESVAKKNKDVKVNYSMRCKKCRFTTESSNVMWWHHEHPHTDPRENLFCYHCNFASRVPVAFSFHMEAEHRMQGRVVPKPAFWQCSICQFETNSKGLLTKHKWKCEKSFDYRMNLCPTSSHVNYCLAYNFYRSAKKEEPKKQHVVVHPKSLIQPRAPVPPRNVQPHRNSRQLSAPVVRPPQPMIRPSGKVKPPTASPPWQAPVTTTAARMQMNMILGNFQQPVVIRNAMGQPQIQYIPAPPATANLTVQQMLNSRYPQTMNQTPPQMKVNQMIQQQKKAAGVRVPMPVNRGHQVPAPRPVHQQQQDLGLVSCEICRGFVKDKDALRVHFFFAHQIDLPATLLKRAQPPLFCEVCYDRFWTSQGLQKHKETLKHFVKTTPSAPVSAQVSQSQPSLHVCIICGIRVTHLLNHMSSIHNLSLKDFLVAKRCVVCGGSFANRPSLEIHLASSHGILVKTNPNSTLTMSPASPALLKPTSQPVQRTSMSPKDACASSCIICNISFLNNDLLTKHCLHCHANCLGCGMIFADMYSRSRHKCPATTRVTSLNQIMPCLACRSKVHSRNMRSHVERLHLKKCRVSLKRTRLAEDLAEEVIKRRRRLAEEVIILDDDQDEISAVDKSAPTAKSQQPTTGKADNPPLLDVRKSSEVESKTNDQVKTSEEKECSEEKKPCEEGKSSEVEKPSEEGKSSEESTDKDSQVQEVKSADNDDMEKSRGSQNDKSETQSAMEVDSVEVETTGKMDSKIPDKVEETESPVHTDQLSTGKSDSAEQGETTLTDSGPSDKDNGQSEADMEGIEEQNADDSKAGDASAGNDKAEEPLSQRV